MQREAVKFWWLGGSGLNCGVQFNPEDARSVFVDTSDANSKGTAIPSQKLFLTEGTAGGGSDRAFIYQRVKPQIPKIIEQFPFAAVNVFIHSLPGASGSVLAPLLTAACNHEGLVAISVGIADLSVLKAITNTEDTRKSYDGVAAATGIPTIMHLVENRDGVPYTAINAQVNVAVEALGILFSQKNHRIDQQDVTNWAQYNRLAKHLDPRLTFLSIANSRAAAASVLEPITCLSLYGSEAQDVPFGSMHHRKSGYPAGDLLGAAEQRHFLTSTKAVDDYITYMEDRKAEVTRKLAAYQAPRIRIDIDDNLSEDGMVV